MIRNILLSKLRQYKGADRREEEMRVRIIRFIEQEKNCFERSLLAGHITASALIVNKERTRTLLTHHHKLEKWLQLGGHSDGDPNTLHVALREAEEESGLKHIEPVNENIFDVDIHKIPERKNEPAHFHYDVRFLFEADDSEPLVITSESKDLAWVPLKDIEQYTTEESMLRMIRKLTGSSGS
jgi:8-oxo-dGTP pyrophosphatase MutT (NUDIX family)